MSITENFHKIKSSLPKDVTLVAVSKTHPSEIIQEIYDEGQRVFGENKVQELVEKQEILPKDIEWHLIGHLQTNKVKYIAAFVDTIQSVDSEKILKEINKEAAKNNRKIKILLQVKIAEEDSKYGLTLDEAKILFTEIINNKYSFVAFSGLMGMATFTDDTQQLKQEFSVLQNLFNDLNLNKTEHTLSMGMSGDYETAIECGANSVRVGSAIFGSR
ncbi:YggS family pyridoxal phosphate-dependent enzyme [Frigoriflavimonas asaccharolytica]|uniref:Pyridoxal phosphate homeostasis protein n=1 Tax=Frigoriflavimonas asaccharolytica TaxID=2735899 RepID=A0A8J8K7H5_9FLAO|nr:YggS family pyridoxal phosphate-dependent enzyme [Frigoriflavimonas asaccharolytica]NRS91486.1 hypothetical protein [Frigoriflavimonas asaccharolytica]